MNEFQDWLDIRSILFTFFQNISIFLFLHIIMDLRFSDFMYVHTTTGTLLLLMLKLSELWSVETFFRLASISSWRDPFIFENVLPFWPIKIFQAHLVLLCATHRIRLFPQWTWFLSLRKKNYLGENNLDPALWNVVSGPFQWTKQEKILFFFLLMARIHINICTSIFQFKFLVL